MTHKRMIKLFEDEYTRLKAADQQKEEACRRSTDCNLIYRRDIHDMFSPFQ